MAKNTASAYSYSPTEIFTTASSRKISYKAAGRSTTKILRISKKGPIYTLASGITNPPAGKAPTKILTPRSPIKVSGIATLGKIFFNLRQKWLRY
jgi:hypothetical protein